MPDEETGSRWSMDALRTLMDQRFSDLRLHIDQRFNDQKLAVDAALQAADKAVQAALQAAKEAVLKAEAASNARFEGVNEFRGQLADQQRTLLPRAEYDGAHRAMEEKIAALTERINSHEATAAGGAGMISRVWAVVGGLGVVITVINVVLTRFLTQ